MRPKIPFVGTWKPYGSGKSGWLSLLGAVVAHGSLLATMPSRVEPGSVTVPQPLTWVEVAAAPTAALGASSGDATAVPQAAHVAAPIGRKPESRRSSTARPEPQAATVPVRNDGVAGMLALPVLARAILDDLEQQPSPGERGGAVVDGQGLSQAGGEPASGSPGGHGAGGAGSGGAPGLHASRRGPRLLAGSRGCGSYFPAAAQTEHGQVRVQVRVDAQGRAELDRVLVENPHGQGFGGAASACVRFLRFEPAVDPTGRTVAGRATLHLDFERS